MRLLRSAGAAAAASALIAGMLGATTGAAGAQTPPVATTLTTAEGLVAQLGQAGSLLDVHLLGDTGFANTDPGITDPAVPAPGAYSRLDLAHIATSVAPASALNLTIPPAGPYEAKSTGPTSTSVGAGSLSALTGNLAALAPVLGGTVTPGSLSATPGTDLVTAALDAGLSGISALGGLARADQLSTTLTAAGGSAAGQGTRALNVGRIDLLDLGSLLQGLGVQLDKLTVGQVSDLLDGLGLNGLLTLPSGATNLQDGVAAIDGLIANVESTVTLVGNTVTSVTSLVDNATSTLLGTLGITSLPTVTGTTSTVIAQAQAALDQLNGLLDTLLTQSLTLLDTAPLVRLDGVDVGVVTKAVDTLAGSVASVTGKVGSLHVGGLDLGGLDLGAPAAALDAAVATANSTISGVLGRLDPGLGSLVKLDLLDKATDVVQSGGRTTATAGVTAAAVSLVPPADLTTIVGAINATTLPTVAGLLGGLPALSAAVPALEQVLGIAFAPLGQPATFSVGAVRSQSAFGVTAAAVGSPGGSTPAAPAASPTLPRTGGSPTLPILGGIALVAVLAIRRGLRRAAADGDPIGDLN